MADPTWIETTDLRIAAGNPFYTDVKNRCGQHIWNAFIAEHNTDGTHSDVATRLVIETYSYSGNGTDDRDVALQNANLAIIWLRIWTDQAFWIEFRSADTSMFSGDESVGLVQASNPHANYIQSRGTGTFQLGDADAINKNTETYYYVAIGIVETATGDGTGSDPDWIEHGEDVLGGASTTIFNKVEKHLWEAFQDEHDDDGTHKAGTPFIAPLLKHEIGGWTGNDTGNRNIALTDTSLDILYLEVRQDPYVNMPYLLFRTESPSGDLAFTIFSPGSANVLQSVGTGTFQTSLNTGTLSYRYFVIGV